MIVGQKVKGKGCALTVARNHIGIRFDGSQGAAAAISTPKGASGEVKELRQDRGEALVELYWSDAPRAAPVRVRFGVSGVKRVFFGKIFE